MLDTIKARLSSGTAAARAWVADNWVPLLAAFVLVVLVAAA